MSQANFEIASGARITVPPISEGGGGRRTPEQRLFARFPGLYRLLADAVSRLPPGSRLRRLMLARSIGLAYAAANRRDFDFVLIGWDPGSEYHPSGDLMPPDLEPV